MAARQRAKEQNADLRDYYLGLKLIPQEDRHLIGVETRLPRK
jgi:hypothetical protein